MRPSWLRNPEWARLKKGADHGAWYHPPAMAIYLLRSLGPGGKVLGAQRFSALGDPEALTVAAEMVEGSAVATFEVWQGDRRVEGVSPTIRTGKPRPKKKPRRVRAGRVP